MREPASKRTKLSYVRGPCCMRGNRQVRGQAFICGGVLVARWLFLHILQQAAPVTAMNSYPNCCHQLKHRQPLPGQHITSSPLPRHCRSHGPTVSPSSRRLQVMQADAKPPAARPGYTGDGAPGSEVSALLKINQHRKLDHAMPVRARTWHACSQRLWPPRAPRTTCIGPSGLVASTCPTIQDHLHCQPNAHCQPI